mmetsp:Transcript_26615/g.48257  ORF Transcript_26615/g.48257 Transcript_26615/m.48257 type:complete len:214 (+) Transcript_26615:250-891(+)
MNMTTLPQLPLHRLDIHRRVDIAMSPNVRTIGILLLSAASRSRLSAGNVILGGELANGGPGDGRFDSEDVGSRFDAEEAHFAPVLAPTIPNNPIFIPLVVHSPSNNRDNVIHQHTHKPSRLDDSSLVSQDWIGVDARCDGTATVDFRLDFVNAIPREEVVGAVFCHCGIGKEVDLGASTSLGGERTASPACIVFGARGIDVLAESLVAITGTG